jgi:cobalt-zinc-cadmium efflux system protein
MYAGRATAGVKDHEEEEVMPHGHHGHGHGHHGHGPAPTRALGVALALNAGFLVLEAGVGWWTGSLALLSDAGHMVSDVGALALALFAARAARREPTDAFTFGLERAPVLGALLNAVSLVAIVAWIGVEAVERLGDPPMLEAWPVLWTGVAGLGVNLASAWYLARSQDESVNTRGAMLHLLSDALGSVAAIVSALALTFGVAIADPIASLIIGLLILAGSLPLLRDTLWILLQRAPRGLDVGQMREALAGHPGVARVEELRAWELDAGQGVVSAILTVEAEDLGGLAATRHALRAMLHDDFGFERITLELRTRD